jgi:hypothetical protein
MDMPLAIAAADPNASEIFEAISALIIAGPDRT